VRARRPIAGFTLLEIMVALAMIATVFVLVTQAQRESVAKAAGARSQSIAARLGEQFIHRIEAGQVPDLVDGLEGDFSVDGYGQFTWLLGIGDGSDFSGGPLDETEEVLREFRRRADEERGEDEVLPERTRIYLTISFPSFRDAEREEYQLETLVDTWALEQDFALFEQLWPELAPAAIQ
jgi:prepilin-type N-terminal cleavage/methylation domain-containing protein